MPGHGCLQHIKDAGVELHPSDDVPIAYVTKYKSKVYAQIRGIAKGLRKRPLQVTDVDDLYQQIVEYLHRSDDYNIDKAIERSSELFLSTMPSSFLFIPSTPSN